MRVRSAVIAAALFAVVAAVALAQGGRRDGKWEVTIETEIPGMPMKMQPMTTTKCVTKEQAGDPQKMFGSGGGRGRSGNDTCKYTDQKMEGNKVSWSMTCPDQGMSGSGEMTFGEDSYTGTVKMDMSGRGTMTMKYTGKRLGECDK